MKISILMGREDFPGILQSTLQRYLRARGLAGQEVRWQGGGRGFRSLLRRPQPGLWLVNPTLNAIFSASAGLRVFETPWREYLRAPTVARTLMHAGYLALATAPISRVGLARHGVLIIPDLENAAHTLILGGNTRLRILDLKRQVSTVILKEGFERQDQEHEIAFRKANPDLPAPGLLEVFEDGLSYDEELLRGTVADRLLRASARETALLWALEKSARLAVRTRREQPLAAWLAEKTARAEQVGSRVKDDGSGVGALGNAWVKKLAERAARLDVALPLAQSHGDLQAGNVIVGKDGRWLIDWERTGERVVGYDALTLASKTRRGQKGLVDRLGALLRDDSLDRVEATAMDSVRREWGRRSVGLRMLLFLAEDILFHLEENAHIPIRAHSAAVRDLVVEAWRVWDQPWALEALGK